MKLIVEQSRPEQLAMLRSLGSDNRRLELLQLSIGHIPESDALALATTFGLQAELKDRLGIARYGDQPNVPLGNEGLGPNSLFQRRLESSRSRLETKDVSAESIKLVHDVLVRNVDYLETFSDHEWAELISTCNLMQRVAGDQPEKRIADLIECLTMNDSVLQMHGSMHRYYIKRHELLQHIRRNLLQDLMDPGEFDAIYRYSRDHEVNELLRVHWGKDGIPDHDQGSLRRELRPEELNPHARNSPVRNNMVRPFSPNNHITTGHFIYKLDQGLFHLAEIQGREQKRLYRATMFSQKWIDDLIQKGEFKDFGFSSTSKHPTKLKNFFNWKETKHYDDERATLFYYETSRAVDISHVSRFHNETEHLVPRETDFQAQFLGYRRDLCPHLNVPDHENWAVFALTDDGHPIGEDAIENLRKVALT